MIKRIISLLLSTIVFVSVLTSCGGEETIKYDEAEVIEAASDLIYKSQEFNDIFWGKGLNYIEGSEYDNGIYSPAEPLTKYTSLAEITAAAQKVFSSGYMTTVKLSVLSAQFGDTGVDGYSRYYQEDANEPIMVRTDYSPVLVDENAFLYETLTVVGAEGQTVILTISLKVTRGETSQVIDRRIRLVYEDGWKLDSHTFANFNENL